MLVYTGAPALTSRGLKEKDFEKVVDLLDKGVQISVQAQAKTSKWAHFWCVILCPFVIFLEAPTLLVLIYEQWALIISETLKDFKAFVNEDEAIQKEIKALKEEVISLVKDFPIPGFADR